MLRLKECENIILSQKGKYDIFLSSILGTGKVYEIITDVWKKGNSVAVYYNKDW